MRLRKIIIFIIEAVLVSLLVTVVAWAAEPSQQGVNHFSADKWFEKGFAHQEASRLEDAVAAYSKAISLDPEYAIAYNNRGTVYARLKQYDRAISDIDKAISLNPEYAMAYNNRGNAYDDLKQYNRAMADYGKAISIDPGDASAYNNRGVAYMFGLYKTKEACADWEKACSLGVCSGLNYAKQKGICK